MASQRPSRPAVRYLAEDLGDLRGLSKTQFLALVP
jgi:hypothetical protein